MDQQQSFRSDLVEWLKEIVPYGKFDAYIRKTRETFDADPNADRHANTLRFRFCTDAHTYSVYATPTYLGAGATTRKSRPGEDWNRGNDLPDGKFCRETWDNIKAAIIRYEMVKLDPLPISAAVPDTPTELLSPLTEDEILELERAAVHHNLGYRQGTGKNKYICVSLVQKLIAEFKQMRKPGLRLEGQATDLIWGMVHADKAGTEVIGLRVDCGDAGTLYLSKTQAHEVIDTLNSLLSQLTQQKGKRPQCEIEFKGGKCPCTCLHTTHPVANHAEGCPERPSCGDSLCRVEHTPMEDITRHDTRCPESGPGWA